jgi:hypothetical protein
MGVEIGEVGGSAMQRHAPSNAAPIWRPALPSAFQRRSSASIGHERGRRSRVHEKKKMEIRRRREEGN